MGWALFKGAPHAKFSKENVASDTQKQASRDLGVIVLIRCLIPGKVSPTGPNDDNYAGLAQICEHFKLCSDLGNAALALCISQTPKVPIPQTFI